MPGWSNSDNLFGRTQYVVGTTLGDGCNYDSIQTAYDDAVASGISSVILLRAGIYTVDLLLPLQAFGINIVSAGADGRLPAGNPVNIVGTHTVTGLGELIFENINLTDNDDPVFTWVSPGTGGLGILGTQECNVQSFGAGMAAVDITATGADFVVYGPQSCSIQADGNCVATAGANIILSSFNNRYVSTSGGNLLLSATGGQVACSFDDFTCSTGNLLINAAGPQYRLSYCSLASNNQSCIQYIAAANVIAGHCILISNDGGGNAVTGTGTLTYADLILPGANIIPGTITETIADWKPYARSGAVPAGTSRGTAAFSTNDFTLTDGFVELIGSTSGPITQLTGDSGTATPTAGNINLLGTAGCKTTAAGDIVTIQAVGFSEQLINFNALPDEGYWVDAGVTATLPTAGLVDGTLVEIAANDAGVIIQADPAHSIRLGNQVGGLGGTATSTDAGDILILRYRLNAQQWWATSAIGNWTITP